MSVQGRLFFCSWSGGKDSCLACYHAMQAGGRLSHLVTMLTESGERTRAHGLPVELIRRQARSLGAALAVRAASWDGYEAAFRAAVGELAAEGVVDGVFGDIDVEEHREWCVRVCSSAGARARHPLWQRSRGELLAELLTLGFRATVVVVKDGALGRELLGRSVDAGLVRELEASGVDASGERGEYHTVVTDGPIFREPIRLDGHQAVWRDGYWVLDVSAPHSEE